MCIWYSGADGGLYEREEEEHALTLVGSEVNINCHLPSYHQGTRGKL